MTMLLCGRFLKEPSARMVADLYALNGKSHEIDEHFGPKKGMHYHTVVAPEGHAFVSDMQIQCDIGDGGTLFSRSYEIIRTHGNDILHVNFDVLDDESAYPEDQKQVVGFVVHARDIGMMLNPPEDFLLPPVRCCQLRLRPDRFPILEEKPKSYLMSLSDDGYLIHADLLCLLQGKTVCGERKPIWRGICLTEWFKLQILKRRAILDDISFMPKDCSLKCTACRRPLHTTLDELWFARFNKPIEGIEVNSRGDGHYGKSPILVLSFEMLARIRREKLLRRANIRVTNVYTANTQRFALISMIRKQMERIGEPAARRA